MTPSNDAQRIDWRMVAMLPPKRRFTADELARAQAGAMSRTVKLSLLINLAVPALLMLPSFGPRNPIGYPLVMLFFLIGLLASAAAAWADPSSRAARWAYFGVPVVGGTACGALLTNPAYQRESVVVLVMLVGMGSMALCLGTLHRHSHIEQRLREADERDKAIEMAQRLAGAQLEPHFLFNTLASAQHWVNTQDPRAAPLLAALTGYLRATLPMFKQPLMPVSAELLAVERYLQVMQARLGEPRLHWTINVEDDLQAAQLPPGVLLTLVENAVAHGIEPKIGGGEVQVRGRRDGDHARFTITDNGPGLPANAGADTDLHPGIGLANARQRLALICGPSAQLRVDNGPTGGCVAELQLPFQPSTSAS